MILVNSLQMEVELAWKRYSLSDPSLEDVKMVSKQHGKSLNLDGGIQKILPAYSYEHLVKIKPRCYCII